MAKIKLIILLIVMGLSSVQADVIVVAEGIKAMPSGSQELSEQIQKLCASCATDLDQLGGGGISLLHVTNKKRILWGLSFENLSSQRSSTNDQDFVRFGLKANLLWFHLGWERKGKKWNSWYYTKYLLAGDLGFDHESSFVSNAFNGKAKLNQGYGVGLKLSRKLSKKWFALLGLEVGTFRSEALATTDKTLLSVAAPYLANDIYQNTYLAGSLGLGFRF